MLGLAISSSISLTISARLSISSPASSSLGNARFKAFKILGSKVDAYVFTFANVKSGLLISLSIMPPKELGPLTPPAPTDPPNPPITIFFENSPTIVVIAFFTS